MSTDQVQPFLLIIIIMIYISFTLYQVLSVIIIIMIYLSFTLYQVLSMI